ncbi:MULTISPECIES: ribonuclease domain-containing protein [unclassified Frankia]
MGSFHRSRDTVSGIFLMGARLYNPTTGRFLSVDPVFGGSANPYEYALQDPYNLQDLDGQSWGTVLRVARAVPSAARAVPSTARAVVGAARAAPGAARAAVYRANLKRLPPQVNTVLNRVTSKGSPLPGYKGGATYKNSNGALPRGVSYREWDVYNTKPRGAARIVTGSDGSAYYTSDHYRTFTRIK